MDGHLLVSDLQALVTESKRKNPEVKAASEAALEVLKGGALDVTRDGQHAKTLLEPMLLGCKTKVPKVIGISISALQRLMSLKGVPIESVPTVLQALTAVINQGVDIQLRILQTLLAVLTHCGDVHGDVLGSALLLCFKLQDSKTSVVSSTAAATLRQAVMLVFDRVGLEDAQAAKTPSPSKPVDEALPTSPATLILETEPPTELDLSPSALDAYSIFSDLCLLTLNASPSGSGSMSAFLHLGGTVKEKPRMLKLSSLNRTFGLELVESVLSGFENGVKLHPELLHLLRRSLHPLLLKLLSEKPPSFPITLRVCRLIFLLLKSFADQLSLEAEIYLELLLRLALGEGADTATLGPDHKDVTPTVGTSPMWLRVLSMEILRGICGDANLLSSLWTRYDASPDPSSPRIFYSLISTLNRLATEKPALLGVGSQMHGLGVPTSSTDGLHQGGTHAGSSGYLDMGLGMVASAASAGVSTMSAIMTSDSLGLGPASSMKLQLIEQHDKAEPPVVPDTYIYLLALHCLDAIADGFYNTVIPLFSTYVEIHQPGVTAPLAIDLDKLSQDDPNRSTLATVQGMATAGWPALLAALSYFIGTNLSDEHFADCLNAMQSFTIVCGVLGLETPRDAFLNTISRFAVPPPLVSAMQSYCEGPSTPRNNSVINVDALGLSALGVGSGPSGPPSLSERNLACLKITVKTAQYLAGSLGAAWHDVLEALQNANYILVTRKPNPSRRSVTASPMNNQLPPRNRIPSTSHEQTSAARPAVFDNLDIDSIQSAMNELFEGAAELDDGSFQSFVTALCRLSSEMIGMDASSNVIIDLTEPSSWDPPFSPSDATSPLGPGTIRRRASGMNASQTIRAGERSFGLTKLRAVAIQNLKRLTTHEPALGWSIITHHLLQVARHPTAPAAIRVQAAEVLGELLVAAPHEVGDEPEEQKRLQAQVFDALTRQVDRYPISNTVSTDYDVRSLGLQSLNQILESSGHSLVVGWQTIFGMLNSVCKKDVESSSSAGVNRPLGFASQSNSSEISLASTVGRARPPPLTSSKGDANLVRVAFPSLTLICTDFLSSLDPTDLRLCTASLGVFGRQKDDVNITLAAIGLLWNVSDSIQIARRAQETKDTQAQDDVWLYLLAQLRHLCSDVRLEVRNSAMQTLFRCIELYGGSLTEEMWTDVIWNVIFPLIDTVQLESGLPLELQNAGISEESTIDVDGDGEEKQKWDQSKMLVLSSIGSVFGTFLLGPIIKLPTFAKAYNTLLQHVRRSFIEESRVVGASALKSLSRVLLAVGLDRDAAPDLINPALDGTWQIMTSMGEAVIINAGQSGSRSAQAPYTQESLLCLVQTFVALHDLCGAHWEFDKLQHLCTILRGIISYTRSPEYRPDVDSMSPVQTAVVDLLLAIDSTKPGVSSLVLNDLAEYTTLAYIAAFDYVDQTMGGLNKQTVQKSVTFVALSKHCMPKMASTFEKYSSDISIYNDGTAERVLGAYAIPVKLKYDCPPASKFGDDPPLWKTASVNLVKVLRQITIALASQRDSITTERYEGIWAQVMEVVSAALLADSSPIENLSAADQASEEAFAQPIFDLLKSSIVPELGHPQVPERVVIHFAETLRKASSLWSYDSTAGEVRALGTTANIRGTAQERVASWCLDVLVAAVQGDAQESTEARKRLARLSLPALMKRYRETLESFLADSAIRGQMPFPRVREEELVFVLQQLLRLRLYPSSFVDASTSGLNPALATSPIAHLFRLYKPLLLLATTSFELPSVWVPRARDGSTLPIRPINEVTGSDEDAVPDEVVHVFAKDLARECLELIGDELGLGA